MGMAGDRCFRWNHRSTIAERTLHVHRKSIARRGSDVPGDRNMRAIRDTAGGIEGMPLQLMITVIVAGLTLAVVLGWTLSIQTPTVVKSVTTDPAAVDLGNVPEDRAASKVVSIRVTAYDAKNAPIKDLVVTIGGAVATPLVRQDSEDGAVDGTATFTAVSVFLPPGVTVGELALTIQKAGFPSKSWSIPVVRGA